MDISKQLFTLADEKYKKFHASLMPTVNPEKIIGIRTPVLRKLVKALSEEEKAEFIKKLPHRFYEENNLHMFILQQEKNFEKAIAEIDRFLPFIDNWATCDAPLPKVFEKQRERLLPYVKKWLNSQHTYTVRYGIGVLMRLFLDEDFKTEYIKWVADVKSEEYYVNMMRAWYFATAMTKQEKSTLPYFEKHFLDSWTHNKTIQKCTESYRITEKLKGKLRILRR